MWPFFTRQKRVRAVVDALKAAEAQSSGSLVLEGPLRSLPLKPVQTTGFSLSGGRAGNLETIEVMKALARMRASHPRVRAFALETIEGIPSHAYLSEARAIGSRVKEAIRYVKDPIGTEQLTDPLTFIDQIERGLTPQGDCDDMALLIATLLLSIGIQPVFRAVRYEGNQGHYHHIYVCTRANNLGQRSQWLVLDAIIKEQPIGYEVPHASGDDFPV